jgi:hypothetical protein
MMPRRPEFSAFAKQKAHAREHDPENRNTGFPITIMLRLKSSSNPAAGPNGQGARDLRRDGRHPKTENHGRIAGR